MDQRESKIQELKKLLVRKQTAGVRIFLQQTENSFLSCGQVFSMEQIRSAYRSSTDNPLFIFIEDPLSASPKFKTLSRISNPNKFEFSHVSDEDLSVLINATKDLTNEH